MQRCWMAVCAFGLVVSAALFLGSVLTVSVFKRTAEDLTVERVRRDLQSYLDDDTVSAVAAKRFLERLPSSRRDFSIVDRERLRQLIRTLGEPDFPPTSGRARNSDAGPESQVHDGLELRAIEAVHELRLASAACMLLFGLACWLFSKPAAMTYAPVRAARIAASGATLIGSGYAMTWYHLGADSQGFAVPAMLIATGVVLILVSDALFNDSRATRTALDISRFWP